MDLNPLHTFLDSTDRDKPSDALVSLLRKMGLFVKDAYTFAEIAKLVADANWSGALGQSYRPLREMYQTRMPDIAEELHTLGITQVLTECTAQVGLWGAAIARLCSDRLKAGFAATGITKLYGLATKERPVLPEEWSQLQEMHLDTTKYFSYGQCKEAEMLAAIYEYHRSRTYGFPKEWQQQDFFKLVAAEGKTTKDTLLAWRQQCPDAKKAAIFSTCPYGQRMWMEASIHIPDCEFELVCGKPKEPLVIGCLSEIGKIVYNLDRMPK